jgi:hypothetical protein
LSKNRIWKRLESQKFSFWISRVLCVKKPKTQPTPFSLIFTLLESVGHSRTYITFSLSTRLSCGHGNFKKIFFFFRDGSSPVPVQQRNRLPHLLTSYSCSRKNFQQCM